jgi:hypothetical protein
MMAVKPKYPDIVVVPTGLEHNAYIVVSRLRMEMKRAGVPSEECAQFFDDALSGDVAHTLTVLKEWVTVSG